MLLTILRILFLPALMIFSSPIVTAEGTANDNANREEVFQRELEAASQGMKDAQQKGPLDIPLLNQAVLHLPQGYAYVPNPAAATFMTAMGNRVDENFLGLILPEGGKENWAAALAFQKSGYIRDDDAKSWNVDDMLKSIKEGADETNQSRASRGIPELDVVGWAEPPELRCRQPSASLGIDRQQPWHSRKRTAKRQLQHLCFGTRGFHQL